MINYFMFSNSYIVGFVLLWSLYSYVLNVLVKNDYKKNLFSRLLLH